MTTPRAFISHAVEDNDRFARGFVERLRANGVEAWFDEWELAPGDSLVERIFEEGVGKADVFIVILSAVSIDRPWVREELNAGVVKRIEGSCKLIPVVLDNVEVPEALKATVWQKVTDLANYESEFDRILRAIFGTPRKPALGAPPAYATRQSSVDGLPAAGTALLLAIGDHALEQEEVFLGGSEEFEKLREVTGLTAEGFYKEMLRLGRADYLDVQGMGDSHITHAKLLPKGLATYLEVRGLDLDGVYADVVGSLVNSDRRTLPALAEAVAQPLIVVDLILQLLEAHGLIAVARGLGGFGNTSVRHLDPLLEDELS